MCPGFPQPQAARVVRVVCYNMIQICVMVIIVLVVGFSPVTGDGLGEGLPAFMG